MSTQFTEALLALKETHQIKGTHVPYGFAVEFVNSKGMIDYPYFTRSQKVHGSSRDFGKAVREVFGDIYFTYDEPEETMTKEEFLGLYVFGKFPRVIKWVAYVAKETGKVLRREDLMKWVYGQAPKPKANYEMREVNRIG